MKHLILLTALLASGCYFAPSFADTLYCGQQTEGRQVTENEVSHPRLKSCNTTDLEHVVPASWCLPDTCDDRKTCAEELWSKFYSDPINLQPAVSCINRSRGNKPYGEIEGEATEYTGCDIEMSREAMEPPNHQKTELALRTIATFQRYGAICREPYDGYLELMERWATE